MPYTLDEISKMPREEVLAMFRGFKFEPEDWNWDDYHDGLSPERELRYTHVILAISAFIGDLLDGWRKKGHNFEAMVPNGLFATGVMGDHRAYAPIVILRPEKTVCEGGRADYDTWAEISQAITNNVPVTHVAMQVG
jgi:hypothetical protein